MYVGLIGEPRLPSAGDRSPLYAAAALGVLYLCVGCGTESQPQTDVPGFLAAGTGAPEQPHALAGAAAAPDSLDPLPEAMAGQGTITAMAGQGAPDLGTDGDDSWCGALGVFRTACQNCHGDELAGGAQFPLVTHDHTMAPALSDPSRSVVELIDQRIHDTTRPMPPLSQPRLTAQELGALETWIAAGAPNTAEACTDLPDRPSVIETEPEWPEDCEERYEILAHQDGGAYVVPADSELNVNISIPVPWAGTGDVQALAIRPITGNKRVVHHWILYAGSSFITSWSPGKPMEVFPDGVGVHMPNSGTFRLNMHYFNVGNAQEEPDRSGLEVCITRNPRPNTATTYMFSASATVPAGASVDNTSTCEVVATEPVHLMTSSPHMHQYGVASKLEIIRPDGSVEVLEDGPFNWEDQHVTPIDAVVNTGDQVRMTCSFVNTSDRTVRFGDSSNDEMCLNFARYYPMGAFRCTGGSSFFGR